jgi:acyl-coenzyme A synthetase/AMP-(fatty) acid ligase
MASQNRPATSPSSEASAPPATPDYLRFHAAHRPDAVALINHGHEITYAKFQRDLEMFTRAMRQFALPPGGSVAVACENVYLHWLLLLACETIGLASASFVAREGRAAASLLSYVDLVICDQPVAVPPARRVHVVTQAWVDGVLSLGMRGESVETMPIATRLDDPVRIRRSSGSTGAKKLVMATRQNEEHTLREFQACMGFTQSSRFLLYLNFSVGSIYARATLCLRLGATCICDFRMPLVDALAAHAPTHVMLLPNHVDPLLDALPNGFVKPRSLTVMLTGGPLPVPLTERLLAELATDMVFTDGTNETITISIIGRDGIGTLAPGVQVEVIDDHDVALSMGQAGRLKIKTVSMADGYLGDPESTARVFKDGWFYTDDLGIMVEAGRLKLLGRADEILVIGGLKQPPQEIEDAILRRKLAREAGVTSKGNPGGIDELCIALVLDASIGLDAAKVRIADEILQGAFGPTVNFISIDSLPRTDTGKIQRRLLKAMFRRE